MSSASVNTTGKDQVSYGPKLIIQVSQGYDLAANIYTHKWEMRGVIQNGKYFSDRFYSSRVYVRRFEIVECVPRYFLIVTPKHPGFRIKRKYTSDTDLTPLRVF